MTHYAIQSEVDDISSKLKFIARIQPNQKISIRGDRLSLVSKKSLTAKLWRIWDGTWHNEGREASYEFLKGTIDRAYNLLLKLRHSSSDYDVTVYRNFIIELINVEPGLRNLIATYHKDVDYGTNIATMIDNLKVKITELCDYKGFSPAALRQAAITEIQQVGGGGVLVATPPSLPALPASRLVNESWNESDEEPVSEAKTPEITWATVAAKEPVAPVTMEESRRLRSLEGDPDESRQCDPEVPVNHPEANTVSTIVPEIPLKVASEEIPPPLPATVPSPPPPPPVRNEIGKGVSPRKEKPFTISKTKIMAPPATKEVAPRSPVKNNYEVLYNHPDNNNPFETLKTNYQYDLECGLQPPSRLIKRNKRQL